MGILINKRNRQYVIDIYIPTIVKSMSVRKPCKIFKLECMTFSSLTKNYKFSEKQYYRECVYEI